MWKYIEHTEEDNKQWCWLRGVEWGRWPIFISQPIVPILLFFFKWQIVIVSVIIINLLWTLFVRYQFISINLSYFAVLFVKLKWLACPVMGGLIYYKGDLFTAIIALLWPIIIFIIGIIPTTNIKRIQEMFMKKIKNDNNWDELIKDCDFIKAREQIAYTMTVINEDAKREGQVATIKTELHNAILAFNENPCFQTAKELLNIAPSFYHAFEFSRRDQDYHLWREDRK